MRCVVTGASGQLGAALVRRLLAEGAEILILVRPTSDLWRLGELAGEVPIVHAELEDLAPAKTQVAQFAPDTVFHLGWAGVTADARDVPGQITTNVIGTLDLFEMVRDAGCSTFVGLGSQAEYGPYDIALTEDLPARPITAYGVAKLAAGSLTAKLAEIAGMRHVWLRLIATYGPADDERHLIPAVILQLLRGESPRMTLGEQECDYLYVDDAADAVWRSAATPDARGVYVLGSGHIYSVQEICTRIRDRIDPGARLEFGAVPYRPDQIMHLEADPRRLESVTGWAPATGLDEGLQRTVDYYGSRWSGE